MRRVRLILALLFLPAALAACDGDPVVGAAGGGGSWSQTLEEARRARP